MEIRAGWYRSYDGNYLKLLSIAQFVESEYYSEEVVYEDKLGIRWTQPLTTFFGTVIFGDKSIPKVIYIGEVLPKVTVAE